MYWHYSHDIFRGQDFRTAFNEIANISTFFPHVPLAALSGTLTMSLMKRLPKMLGLRQPVIISSSPHRPHIFLTNIVKESNRDCLSIYENIFIPEIDKLHQDPQNYPVTLCFIPYQYMSAALGYCEQKFGPPSLETTVYGALYSRQDKTVTDVIIHELKKDSPWIRFVLTTSVSGMGFDSPSVSHIIHCVPPRNISQYLQEIGRSGRCYQNSFATLYWCANDIKKNLPGIKACIQNYCHSSSCLWENILSNFGFGKLSTSSHSECCMFCKETKVTAVSKS